VAVQLVRRDLLCIFDRLSLVLKRNGLQDQALEETECAVSLGFLDRQNYGTKVHREVLRRCRENLQRAVTKAASGE
jgi:hypothetical protein